MMSVTTWIYPDAAGVTQQYVNGAGTVPTNVQTNDGDSSYRSTTTDLKIDLFSMDDLPEGAETTDYYRGYVVSRGVGSNIVHRVRLYTSGSSVESGNRTALNGSWTTTSYPFVNDAAGNPWTVSTVNVSQLGYRRTQSSGPGHRVTQVKAYVRFKFGAGMLMNFGWKLIPPLLASGLFSHGLLCEPAENLVQMFRQVLGPKSIIPVSGHELIELCEALTIRPKIVQV